MLQLFYSPGAISLVCHIALEEAGADFALEKISLTQGEQNQKSFRRLNPLGQVPVLMLHGEPLTESLAILDYIDRAYPTAQLLPTDAEQRAQVMSFLLWLANNVHTAIAGIWRPSRFCDDESSHAAIKAYNLQLLEKYLGEIETRLKHSDTWLFETYSFADISLLPYYRWGNRLRIPMREKFPAFAAHADRLLQRCAVSTVIQREQIDLAENE